jgi:hypothetical protein
MAEHSSLMGHCILLNNINILARNSRHRNQLLREVMEMKLHPSNMNRKDKF